MIAYLFKLRRRCITNKDYYLRRGNHNIYIHSIIKLTWPEIIAKIYITSMFRVIIQPASHRVKFDLFCDTLLIYFWLYLSVHELPSLKLQQTPLKKLTPGNPQIPIRKPTIFRGKLLVLRRVMNCAHSWQLRGSIPWTPAFDNPHLSAHLSNHRA